MTDYEPYGEEWKKEMSKMPKAVIIDMYSKVCKELSITDALLNERQRLLDAIPECHEHGKCVPHALEWVNEHIKSEQAKKQVSGKIINLDMFDKTKLFPNGIKLITEIY